MKSELHFNFLAPDLRHQAFMFVLNCHCYLLSQVSIINNPFIAAGIVLANNSGIEMVFLTCSLSWVIRGVCVCVCVCSCVYKFFDYTVELASVCVSILLSFLIRAFEEGIFLSFFHLLLSECVPTLVPLRRGLGWNGHQTSRRATANEFLPLKLTVLIWMLPWTSQCELLLSPSVLSVTTLDMPEASLLFLPPSLPVSHRYMCGHCILVTPPVLSFLFFFFLFI